MHCKCLYLALNATYYEPCAYVSVTQQNSLCYCTKIIANINIIGEF